MIKREVDFREFKIVYGELWLENDNSYLFLVVVRFRNGVGYLKYI